MLATAITSFLVAVVALSSALVGARSLPFYSFRFPHFFGAGWVVGGDGGCGCDGAFAGGAGGT